jgi:hypothetical protein
VQRFNSTLGCFVHFHVIVPDGVFRADAAGAVVFREGPAPPGRARGRGLDAAPPSSARFGTDGRLLGSWMSLTGRWRRWRLRAPWTLSFRHGSPRLSWSPRRFNSSFSRALAVAGGRLLLTSRTARWSWPSWRTSGCRRRRRRSREREVPASILRERQRLGQGPKARATSRGRRCAATTTRARFEGLPG